MSFLDNQPPRTACSEFSPEELAEAAAGSLDEARAHELSSHLETCPICQAEMEQIVARLFSQPGGQIPGDEEKAEDIRAFLARSQIAPPPLADFQAGDRVDRYEIVRMLGKGGSGTVYECVDHQMGRHVALKVLHHPSFFNMRQARYEREARVLARLDHPWIVKAFEIKPFHYPPYIVMELVRGGSSRVLIEHGPLEAREAARLVAGVARAVQHAHDQNVLHRDLKPSNLLVVEPPKDGKQETGGIALKVSDFGLARPIQNDSALTSMENIIGTPAYMSPEQARGSHAEIGPASDLYALGVVLYEYLVGRPPLLAENAVQTLRLVQEVEPVPPRHIQPGIPLDLDTICMKCLRKDSAERYASAAALADDLERFLENRPIMARPIGPLARLYRWCRRNPSLAATIGTSLVLLGLLAGLSVRFAVIQNRLRQVAEENATRFKMAEEKARRAAQEAVHERDFARNLFFAGVRNLDKSVLEMEKVEDLRAIQKVADKIRRINRETIEVYSNRFQQAEELRGDAIENLFRDAVALIELGYDTKATEILNRLIDQSRKLRPDEDDYQRSQRVAMQAVSTWAFHLKKKGRNQEAARLLDEFHRRSRPDYTRLDQTYFDLVVMSTLLNSYVASLREIGQADRAAALKPDQERLVAAVLAHEAAMQSGQHPARP